MDAIEFFKKQTIAAFTPKQIQIFSHQFIGTGVIKLSQNDFDFFYCNENQSVIARTLCGKHSHTPPPLCLARDLLWQPPHTRLPFAPEHPASLWSTVFFGWEFCGRL